MVERFGSIAVQALVLAFVGCVIARICVYALFTRFWGMRQMDVAAMKVWVSEHPWLTVLNGALIAVIFGPASEEVLFRALLVQYGDLATWWTWGTMVGVSALFAVGHRDKFVECAAAFEEHPPTERMLCWAKRVRVANAFILGIALAWIGIATRSLYTAFLAHAAWNFLTVTRLNILIPLFLFACVARIGSAIVNPICVALRRRRIARMIRAAWPR